MHLWPPEVEAERAEARATAAEALPFVRELLAIDPERRALDPLAALQEQRERFATLATPDPDATDRTVAGVRSRILVPEGPPRAVYLHLHGGGMVAGTPEMSDADNRALARDLGLAVVSVDYRLAPEAPHPAGVDDALAVATWLIDGGAAELGAERIVLGGESAGAYLAAAVALRLRDLGRANRLAGLDLVYGVYDWGGTPSQRGVRPTDADDLIDPEGLRLSAEWYLPGRTADERRHPALSPAWADLRALPPAFLTVGTADHLVDDTLLLAMRWAAAGNDVELFVAPDLPHAFTGLPCALTRRWAATRHAWLDRICSPPA